MVTEKENTEIIEDLDFELIIGDAGGQIDNGDVPIRWCIKPDFVEQLEALNIVDPHVLISSYYDYPNERSFRNEMDRKLVPLSELMTYLRFTKAGKCKVVGVLLDGKCGRKILWDTYMRKNHHGWKTNIVSNWDGRIHSNIDYSVVVTSDFVEIPNNVFGREPSPWIKWYTNLWHSSDRITDECDFRKRFLIAFIFKWIAFIPWLFGLTLFRVVFAGGVWAAGYIKSVKFLRVFRPYKYPSVLYNIIDDANLVDDNIFLVKRPDFAGSEHSKTTTMFAGLALTPIAALGVAAIAALAANDFIGFLLIEATAIAVIFGILLTLDAFVLLIELLIRLDIGVKIVEGIFSFLVMLGELLPKKRISTKYQKIALLGFLGIIALIVVGFIFKYLLLFLGAMIVSMGMMFGFFFLTLLFANQILDWLDNYFAMSAKDNTYGDIVDLLCPKDEDNLRPNYKYIPKKQRTIRLWYHDLKNKVCKPMQS